MREGISTAHGIDVFVTALEGQNFSPKTVRAYADDLAQFTGWLATVRVDWDNPKRLGKTDVEAFLHHLSGRNLTGVSRARKLAAIRKFLAFLHENGVLQTNPAATVKGAPAARRRSRPSSTRNSTRRSSTRPLMIPAITRLS
jgi:integrase/recombinase XerC